MPPEVWFYHLERAGLEAVLPGLLEKGLERGWRALVRTTSRERVAALDEALWTYRDDAFLPHGRGDDPDPELQPVLLSHGTDTPNDPQLLILIDRAPAGPIDSFERVVLVFDGQDAQATEDARAQWKSFGAAGLSVAYWQQSPSGKWEKRG